MQKQFEQAAKLIANAKVLIITAGAGMGVDSGLPDFRGDQGFWKAYPMYENLGINFYEAATPNRFSSDPAFSWGFYGHRAELYHQTVPHQGFQILKKWIEKFGLHHFIITSNVDNHFQKAGFSPERIWEVHGSLSYLQCVTPCKDEIWELQELLPIDLNTMNALQIPQCPYCGNNARPNVLMFNDYFWVSDRTDAQERRLENFLHQINRQSAVIIELGAGMAVPTIRHLSMHLGKILAGTVIRINPREAKIPSPHLSLNLGSLEALAGISAALAKLN